MKCSALLLPMALQNTLLSALPLIGFSSQSKALIAGVVSTINETLKFRYEKLYSLLL